jgi:RNA polymerase sigma-70 factor, ECF subfamily
MLNLLDFRNAARMSVDKSPRKQANRVRLLDRLKSGDQTAIDELTSRYTKAVYHFLYSQVNHHQVAEELTEATFFMVWGSLSKGEHQDTTVLSHLFQVASKLLDDYQKEKPDAIMPGTQVDSKLTATSVGSLKSVEDSKEHQKLKQALNRLDDDFQTVLVSRFFSGLSVEEIAQMMGRKPEAVLLLQYQALTSLNKILGQR